MPFLPTNQQSQSTEGKTIQNTALTIINCLFSADLYHKQWSTIKTGYLQFQPMTFSLDIQHPKDINIKLKYIFTAVYDDEFEPMLITNWAASFLVITMELGWLGSRVVSVLDSRRRRARVQMAVVTRSGNSLRQTVHTHCASVQQAAKLVAALLRVAGVTAGLAESNGSLPPGLRLTSPAG